MHWYEAVRELRACKLELARLDPRGGMPIRPPAGATADDLARAERRLGRPLPPSYRALLASQDGWPRLVFGASLLGATPIARGTYLDVARMVLSDLDPASLGGAPLRRGGFVPFAIDAEAETLAVWDLDDAHEDGELGVILVTNDVALRLPDVPSFLELCLDVLCAEIDERRAAGRREPALPASVDRRSRAA